MSSSEPHLPDAQPVASADGEPQAQDGAAERQRALRDRLLLLLAAVAGYTDAISYVALGNIFAANMTGSTVLLGLSLAQGHRAFALRAGTALAGFLVGVASGSTLIRRRVSGRIWPRAVTLALAVEVGVMALFSALGILLGTRDQHGVVYLLIALAACAMGIQSAAVRSLGVADISTTYLTGTWVALMAGLSRHVRAKVEAQVEPERHAPLPSIDPQKRDAALLLVYAIAAVLCGLLINAGADVGTRVALLPLAPALAVVVGIATRAFRPSAPR
ncbi:MAG TPA: YoaK family protein [Ktedonobacterales bacterium]|jgi:uncharacterized membrane protein YoaK (UPF0700 family)